MTVTNASTNEPLSGVSVRGSGEPSTTDASGQAWVRQRPGSAIVVLHEGHTPVTLDYTGEDALAAALTPSRMVLAIQDLETGRPITTALVQLLEDASAATVPGDATTLPVASRLERPDDEGRLVINDALSFARLGIKAPGYRYTSVPITQAGEISISLEPFEMRGVYVPFGLLTVPDRLYSVLELVSSSELNAIVVDVKSDRAWLAWPSQHPYVLETEAYISGVMDLHEFIDECHSRGIYVVARMVIFKDTLLAEEHDELAVKTSEGGLYTDLEDLHWVDPYRQEVRDYNVQLALEAVSFGFDEVQFDYLRFPSDGSVRGLVYSQESDFDTRTQAMNEFVAQAAQAIAPTSAYFSADIFGLTVWVDPARDMGIGQRLDDIAPYVDYLSPMLYPTTFGEGNLGFERPGLHPYEVVYHSVLKARSRTSTLVRPWLQHYSLGIDYGVKELLEQKKGADDGGSAGWIFWNAGARYMDEIFAENAYSLLDPVPTLEPDPTAPEDE